MNSEKRLKNLLFCPSDKMSVFFPPALILFLAIFSVGSTSLLYAFTYDPYAPVSVEEKQQQTKVTKRKELARPIANLTALPFDVVKFTLDPVIYEIESRHIPRKLDWIYDELKEEGIKPLFVQAGIGRGFGIDLEAVKLTQLEGTFPGVTWHNEIKWVPVHDQFRVGSIPEIERIFDSPVSLNGGFVYERLGEEDFWGIGPDSGLGQGSNYDLEKTAFTAGADVDFAYLVMTSFLFGYEHVNIAEGFDSNETHGGGKNNIKAAFPTLPGINGSDEINFNLSIAHDNRNNKVRPTKGHREKLDFGYHHGVRGSDTRYFKYAADLSIFVPVWSDRRVLAVRWYGEHNSEMDSDEIPFFNKARLGGHLSSPDDGAPLRSFERNRFFDDSLTVLNIEYRYNVWHYRDYKMDAVLFFDEGQVFDKLSEMQIKDFRESYGGGLRVFLANKNILTVEVAFGEEGAEFYARTGSVF